MSSRSAIPAAFSFALVGSLGSADVKSSYKGTWSGIAAPPIGLTLANGQVWLWLLPEIAARRRKRGRVSVT